MVTTDREATSAALLAEIADLKQELAAAEGRARKRESRQVEEDLLKRSADLELINDLNRAINRGSPLHEVIRRLSEETRRIFSAHGAAAYLVDARGEYLELLNYALPGLLRSQLEGLIGTRLPRVRIRLRPEGFYAGLLAESKPRIINDAGAIRQMTAETTENRLFKRLVPRILSILGIGSVIAVPLVSDRGTVGLVDLSRREPFTEEDLRRLVAMVEPIIAAIERKRAEVQLRTTRDFLQRTLDGVNDPLLVIGTDYEVELMNRAFRTRYLPDEKETDGVHRCYELLHGLKAPCTGERHPCLLEQIRRSLRPTVMVTEESAGETGEPRIVEIVASPHFREDGTFAGIIQSARDITERRRREKELFKTRNIASLGVLAAGIAHDFNNLLTVVMANVSLISSRIGGDEAIRRRLEDIESAGQRAVDLTSQLLTFAKGGAPVREAAPIQELIAESVRFSAHGTSVRCELDIADDLWPVSADAGQISQVLNNLIINAIQAMPGGGTVEISARNETRAPGWCPSSSDTRWVRISVRDRGAGIPREHLDKIFDPYFTTKEGGRGLGLATTYSIIESHDGLLRVESRPGEGTAFHIHLPACPDEECARPRAPFGELGVGGGGRILVMDDEQGIRDVATSMLEQLGYSAESAANGAQALELYREAVGVGRPFQAVILDVTVPGGMGGVDVMPALLEMDPDARVVASSGYPNSHVMSRFGDFGFRGVLPKPYDIRGLSGVLRSVLGNGDGAET